MLSPGPPIPAASQALLAELSALEAECEIQRTCRQQAEAYAAQVGTPRTPPALIFLGWFQGIWAVLWALILPKLRPRRAQSRALPGGAMGGSRPPGGVSSSSVRKNFNFRPRNGAGIGIFGVHGGK